VTEYLLYFNQQWVGDHTGEWFRGRGPLAMAVVAEMKAAASSRSLSRSDFIVEAPRTHSNTAKRVPPADERSARYARPASVGCTRCAG
jgi:hypothetical protein